MRFDILFVASLLPALSLGVALGPAAAKKLKKQDNSQQNGLEGAQLLSTEHTTPPPKFDEHGNAVSPSGRPNDHAGSGKGGFNFCGQSSFVTVTIAEPEKRPLQQDCLDLSAALYKKEHRFIIPTHGRQLVRYKSVGFFAIAKGRKAAAGNEDLGDLLFDSATSHSQDGYVSVKGSYPQSVSESGAMACDDPEHTKGIAVDVDWTIGPPAPGKDGISE